MKAILYFLVDLVATVHDYLLHLNDSFELYFSDKELHFLVMGVLGLALFLGVKWLFKRLSPSAIAWVYTLTVMGMLGFAIEIGQYVTHTGNMELSDIAMGMWGVMAFGAAYTLLHLTIKALRKGIKGNREGAGG